MSTHFMWLSTPIILINNSNKVIKVGILGVDILASKQWDGQVGK